MFRIFGTPQDIEESSPTLEAALDPEALKKKQEEEARRAALAVPSQDDPRG